MNVAERLMILYYDNRKFEDKVEEAALTSQPIRSEKDEKPRHS
jgi:hypothetical protein